MIPVLVVPAKGLAPKCHHIHERARRFHPRLRTHLAERVVSTLRRSPQRRFGLLECCTGSRDERECGAIPAKAKRKAEERVEERVEGKEEGKAEGKSKGAAKANVKGVSRVELIAAT
jgi:hypothetical protein